MNYQKGQSLIELLIAIAIFLVVSGALIFFVLDSYIIGRLSREITVANFLAEEGLEAVRSIRDYSWSSLVAGSYGLAVSGNNWALQEQEEDISFLLREGTRKIIIEDFVPFDPDKKKIISLIIWQFDGTKQQEIKLVTYLTNWSKAVPYLAQSHYRWRADDGEE